MTPSEQIEHETRGMVRDPKRVLDRMAREPNRWVRFIDGLLKGAMIPVESGPPTGIDDEGLPAFRILKGAERLAGLIARKVDPTYSGFPIGEVKASAVEGLDRDTCDMLDQECCVTMLRRLEGETEPIVEWRGSPLHVLSRWY